jgi:Phosphatidylinositol N-acetylglucosaminyltransferase
MNEITSVSTNTIEVSKEQRCLWIPRVKGISPTTGDLSLESCSYASIYQQFAVKPETARRSLFRYVANTIVVLQEFVLSIYFFSWHQLLILKQGDSSKQIAIHPHQRFVLDLSTTTMYVALLLAVIFNARSATLTSNKNRSSHSSTAGLYKSKVLFRIVDTVVLALLLRYVAALLHDLTVSYSTDTVELLAASAMIVHLLFCDFSYANGYRIRKITTSSIAGRSTVDELHGVRKRFQAMDNHRPSFMGGTMSLNASFFATILLMSRFEESNAVTSTSSFVFVSLSVVLFAFYPVARHTISVIYPPHRSGEYLTKLRLYVEMIF